MMDSKNIWWWVIIFLGYHVSKLSSFKSLSVKNIFCVQEKEWEKDVKTKRKGWKERKRGREGEREQESLKYAYCSFTHKELGSYHSI